MSNPHPSPLTQLREGSLPKMVRWYNPRLLFKIGVRTIVSSVFGQYADQRLIQAATDASDEAEIKVRYDYSDPQAANPDRRIKMDASGAYWVDYLADTGDGFESTYTMAYLAALDTLRVNDADNKTRLELQHGEILIMGGDQCYPQATREEYKKRLVTPFSWAYDVPQAERKLFAIPGNHDWYDGLNAFDSLFCASRDRLSHSRGEKIGGWQCQQHRSYWALKLPYDWWIWGTDIQFSKFLDSTQVSYFETMATQMKPGDKLILCISEPSWLLSDFGKDDEEENFFAITRIARQAGAKICAVVAGDWHVYARYFSPELDVHFITAGGGGAFLHPTHVLRNDISVVWPKQVDDGQARTSGYGPPAPEWTKETVDIRLKANPPTATVGRVAERVGEVIEEAREAAQEAVKDASEAVSNAGAATVRPTPVREPAAAGRKLKTRIKQKDAKCYPERGRSVLLSLANLWFPLRNVGFALGIGLVYWLITWEFYALVTRHDISSGEIDGVGIYTSFWPVYKYTPFYLIQGLLVSLPLAFMMGSLWFLLTWYVDSGSRRRFGRYFRKFVVGTLHFSAHVAAMFALGLLFVQVNNQITPPLHAFAESVWVGSAKDTSSISGAVAKKVLEPLSEGRQQQRKMFEGDDDPRVASRRAAPPASAMPDGAAPPSAMNKLDQKAVRQLVGFIFYPLEIVLVGGLIGGFIWGLYWVLTGILLRMHAEDAFAALRINDYKNFLRFKFEKDKLTIYPIGVDKVPSKRFWISRQGAKAVPSHNPQLIASKDIGVRLIERPIVIHADAGDEEAA